MLSSKRLVSFCITLFLSNVIFLVLFIKIGSLDRYFITINNDVSGHSNITLPKRYLSFGIDTSEIDRFASLLSNKRFLHLATALSPARIRVGGTMSERLIFSSEMDTIFTCERCHNSPSKTCVHLNKLCRKKFLPYFIMTASQWTNICEFAERTNLRLLFSFNVLLRDGNKWDDTNARELLQHSSNIKCRKVDWQLGNEPNSFPHTFNVTITPAQLASDFAHLRVLLDEFGYKESLLVGPDTTRPQPGRPSCIEYMVQFLGNVSNSNNVRSWHQYYLNSRTAKLEDFWKPDTFDLLKNQLETMKTKTHQYDSIPMWLSETSSAYGGGARGLSDSFSSSPLWIDKLGLSALYNVTTVVRQSLIGGNYSLLDENLDPLPDWWVSILYNKLVGSKVVNLHQKCPKFQRFYAHCANRHYTNDKSAITLFGMNLQMSKLKFLLNGTAFQNNKMVIEEYVLGAPSNNRKSKVLLLNGKQLSYNSKLPKFKPRITEYTSHIIIPPYSIGFWIIKNTDLKMCNY